mgnify:CR=1 FL=1
MKKPLATALCAMLFLTACTASSDNKKENSNSGSLVIDDTTDVIQSSADEYCQFTLKSPAAMTDKETLDLFNDYYDEFFSDKLTNEQKDNECRLIADELKQTDEEYPYCYPKIADHYDDILNDKYSSLYMFLDTSKCHLAVIDKVGLYILDLGGAYSIKNSGGVVGMYCPENEYETKRSYYVPNDDKYTLADKELTVKEAAASAEALLNDLYKTDDKDIKAKIFRANAIDMGEHIGISFVFGGEYKGIPFDCFEADNPNYAVEDGFSNGEKYKLLPAYAFMQESDSIDISLGFNSRYIIDDVKKLDKIISLDECTDIVNKSFSEYVTLKAQKIQLVYTLQYNDENGSSFSANPAWKYSVTDQNGNKLFIYVNAVSGKCYYQTFS